jgi:hypothetical protein
VLVPHGFYLCIVARPAPHAWIGSQARPEADEEEEEMIPKPTTREQARSNAIMAAEEAHTNPRAETTIAWAAVSRAWSDIAQTFPYDEPEYHEIREDDHTIYTVPFEVTPEERGVICEIREGSLVTVHPDYVLEHQDLVRNQFRVEPGYVGMAVTPDEQRAVMAMRSGDRPEETTQVLPMIRPVQNSGGVRLTPEFYMILIAIAVDACMQALGDGDGVILIDPRHIEEAKTKSVVVAPVELQGANHLWKVWLAESGS